MFLFRNDPANISAASTTTTAAESRWHSACTIAECSIAIAANSWERLCFCYCPSVEIYIFFRKYFLVEMIQQSYAALGNALVGGAAPQNSPQNSNVRNPPLVSQLLAQFNQSQNNSQSANASNTNNPSNNDGNGSGGGGAQQGNSQ